MKFFDPSKPRDWIELCWALPVPIALIAAWMRFLHTK